MPLSSSSQLIAPDGSACSGLARLTTAAETNTSDWVSRQIRAMTSAWSRGQKVSAADLLARHPGLSDEVAVRLIYEEVCLRRDAGQDVATTEVINRFPRWKDELEVLLGCDRMLRPFSRVATFPIAGDDLGPFRLLGVLGAGASGKTYLASEPALGNRLVALKVITDDQDEHLSLARLRHTHIIPLFSEQSFPERGLRGLCMPYLGGASLARLLEGLALIPLSARTGQHILDLLDRMRSVVNPEPAPSDGPYRRFLAQASYIQAICWFAACLADALSSTHAHGLVHMDVKPSNVLIADDGLPMLLDFHLAHRPIEAGEFVADRLGGTAGWMAPEHRAAFNAVRCGNAAPVAVDGRADLYALGLLIREALADPTAPTGPIAGRGLDRKIGAGLADIIGKCLAEKPDDRYQNAAALADDLRLHLNDQPMRGVTNRSLIERFQKWRRRRPAALTRWTALATTFLSAGAALSFAYAEFSHRVLSIENNLNDSRQLCRDQRFAEAAVMISRGLGLARQTPFVPRLKASLTEALTAARRGQKAVALHRLAELIRFRYGADLPPQEEALAVFESTRMFWKDRELLFGNARSDDTLEQSIRTDLLDLTIESANMILRLGSADDAGALRREADGLLAQAERWCGPSGRLDEVRNAFAGTPDPHATQRERHSATVSLLEHSDRGRALLRARQFAEATHHFQYVVDEHPQDFWPRFYLGLCAFRLGQFHAADAAFSTCIALAPQSAECYYNRARTAESLGRDDRAFHDYSRALTLDPTLAAAALNRGILALKCARNDAAIADFRRAMSSTSDKRTLGLAHYNLALAFHAVGDQAAAIESAQQAKNLGHPQAPELADELDRDR
jgi:serine/threonine protein kinase/Flp pilus assembly protein TadD